MNRASGLQQRKDTGQCRRLVIFIDAVAFDRRRFETEQRNRNKGTVIEVPGNQALGQETVAEAIQ